MSNTSSKAANVKRGLTPETEVNLITGALILAAFSITTSVYLGARVIFG
jgi:hypothetical protein